MVGIFFEISSIVFRIHRVSVKVQGIIMVSSNFEIVYWIFVLPKAINGRKKLENLFLKASPVKTFL